MLKKILSISGRPGLFHLISQGKNMLIVEALDTKKRFPVHARDKVISVADVSMYTDDGGDKPLPEILEALKTKAEGKEVDIKAMDKNDGFHRLFAEVLPNYDRDRVRTSDIRKLLQWYNALVAAGITEFTEVPAEEKSEEPSTEK